VILIPAFDLNIEADTDTIMFSLVDTGAMIQKPGPQHHLALYGPDVLLIGYLLKSIAVGQETVGTFEVKVAILACGFQIVHTRNVHGAVIMQASILMLTVTGGPTVDDVVVLGPLGLHTHSLQIVLQSLGHNPIECGTWVLAQDVAVEIRVREVMGVAFPIGVLAHARQLLIIYVLHLSLYRRQLSTFQL